MRFYERKEIKDALAYLKVIINPHDDVSLRRVINVPARGIGKGVIDGLESLPPPAELPPLLAAGLEPVTSVQLAVGAAAARDRRAAAAAPRASPRWPPSATSSWRSPTWHGAIPCRSRVGKMLDQSGYLHDLREERSEEAEGRIENLMELVSAAQGIRDPRPRAVAWRLRRSAVAAVGHRRGAGRRATRACG